VGFIVGDDGSELTGGDVVVVHIVTRQETRDNCEIGFDGFGGGGEDVAGGHD